MEEFSPPNKMLDRLATIHPVVWATAQPEKNSGAPPWLAYLHRRSASKRSLDVPRPTPPRACPQVAAPSGALLQWQSKSRDGTGRIPQTRPQNTKGTAQHEVRSTHGRIQRRRLH